MVVLEALHLLDEILVALRGDFGERDEGQRTTTSLSQGAGLVVGVLCPSGGIESWIGAQRGRVWLAHVGDVEANQGVWVVLEVSSDSVVRDLNLDTGGIEDSLGSDTAKLQELDSVDSTSSKDDLLLRIDGLLGAGEFVGDLDTLGSELLASIEDEFVGHGLQEDLEVGAADDRVMVGVTSVGSLAGPRVEGGRVPRSTIGLAIVAIEGHVGTRTLERREVVLDIGVLEVGDTDLEGTLAVAGTHTWSVLSLPQR